MNNELTNLQTFAASKVKNIMTMQEIAEAMGVSKDTIRNCVRRIFPAKMQQGKTAYFDESEVACISKELKSNTHALSYQTSEVTSQVKNTTTRLEVLANYKAATQAMLELLEAEKAELQAENERQKQQLIEAAPKVDFYNAVTESKDCIDMAQVAKVLNIKGLGRTKLFELLRKTDILNRRNIPYQKYVNMGYFRIIETSYSLPDGTQRINLKTVVFQKGVDFIRKVIKQNLK